MDNDPADSKKPHRERQSGRKAVKKKEKNKHIQELTPEQRNPKAFAINSAIRAERKFRRSQDLKSKKEHIPLVDRTTLEPPPILVAVVGPPKVGKSTLIRCMIKSYSNQPLSTIKGPVTVVSGKKRRITFIECNNDINSMVDLAKVADLCLLLIDASFGFEMEIFEFLNICQVHGMPKIMGVLTHLDMIKQSKKLQKVKKTLKRRFWTEVYAGAKLFYLSGQLHNEYLRNEVKNLCRFISVMKFRPLTWQTSHPYMLADRIEDITSPEDVRQNPQVDRKVCIYGYVRGVPLNKKSFIHIPGCGDFELSDVCFLPDPCPLPEQLKKRSLIEKERLIYAPFSGVGGIVYDKDAVYVELSHISMKKDEEVKEMVENLIDTKETLDEKLARSTLQIFSNSKPLLNDEFDRPGTSKDASELESSKNEEEIVIGDDGRKRRKVRFKDSPEEDESDNDEDEENEEEDMEENDEKENNEQLEGNESEESLDESEESDGELELPMQKTDPEKRKHETSSLPPKKKRKVDESSFQEVFENEASIPAPSKAPSSQTEKDKEVKSIVSSVLADLKEREISKMEACNSSSDESCAESDDDLDVGSVPWNKSDAQDSDGESIEADDGDDSGVPGSDDDEEGDLENTEHHWKSNLAQRAADEFLERQTSKKNLWKLVYDFDFEAEETKKEDRDDEESEIGGLFKVVREKQQGILKDKDYMNALDCSKFLINSLRDWTMPEVQKLIKDKFVTGKWKMEEDANELLKLDDLSDDEEEMFGDFEDLETGEKFKAKDKPKETQTDTNKNDKDSENAGLSKEELLEKKKKLKEKFDMAYDNKDEETFFDEMKREANRQAELNKSQFEGLDDRLRVELEGFRAGMYVRMEISRVPCELITNFDPTYPLIAGGLQPQEQNIGYVKARIKKHRWYNKILKNRDPLIISVGWRRFQTVAVFSKQEDNMRHRMLKYTPEHVACMAHFWGPMMRSGSGYLALKDAGANQGEPGFRVMATGTILDCNQSTVVTKKLKLIGEPMKIFKKTAFIKGMFNSTLEVAKFEGAKIKTVSGIRGQIKKAINDPQGAFRATFEDKILLSDIVFCRTWYRVDVPKFYAPITSLLLPPKEKNMWQGMKTMGQLKREHGLHNEAQPDSMYTEIVRKPKKNRPLVVPRAVQRDLPFKHKVKPIVQGRQNKMKGIPFANSMKKVVIRNDKESKMASMLFKLKLCYQDKQEKLKKLKHEKMQEFIKKKQSEEFRRNQRQKAIKKKIFRALSKSSGPPSAV